MRPRDIKKVDKAYCVLKDLFSFLMFLYLVACLSAPLWAPAALFPSIHSSSTSSSAALCRGVSCRALHSQDSSLPLCSHTFMPAVAAEPPSPCFPSLRQFPASVPTHPPHGGQSARKHASTLPPDRSLSLILDSYLSKQHEPKHWRICGLVNTL